MSLRGESTRKEKINRPSKFYIIHVNSANNPNILSLLRYKSGKATDGSRRCLVFLLNNWNDERILKSSVDQITDQMFLHELKNKWNKEMKKQLTKRSQFRCWWDRWSGRWWWQVEAPSPLSSYHQGSRASVRSWWRLTAPAPRCPLSAEIRLESSRRVRQLKRGQSAVRADD